MKRLIFVYRNNVLFERFMWAVFEALRSQGHKLSTLVIPASISVEDARRDASAFLEQQTQGDFYVSDRTCALYELSEAASNNAEKLNIRDGDNLDDIFASIVQEQLEVGTFEESFKKVLLMHCKDRNIGTVHLVEESLPVHISTKDGVDSLEFKKQVDREFELAGNQSRDAWYKNYANKFMGFIHDVLPDVGIVRHEKFRDALNAYSNDGKELIIVDRHALDINISDRSDGAPVIYSLPPSMALAGLAGEGRIDIPITAEQICEKLSASMK